MAAPFKKTPGCCGCSGGTQKCYYFCEACDHRYRVTEGTVTDDNGTWIPEFTTGSSGFMSIGNFRHFAYGPGFRTCDDRRVEYFIRFQCGLSEGKISARIEAQATLWFFDCRWPDFVFVYYPNTGFYRAISSNWSHATLSGCDPLTASFSFTKSPLWPAYLPLPTTSATISLPVDELTSEPGDPICCGPCAIPRTNLTLSWRNSESGTGSGTLVYDALYRKWGMPTGGPWGAGTNDGTSSLKCGWGVYNGLAFNVHDGAGAFGFSSFCNYTSILSSIGLVDYTCYPFHMHFRLDDDAIYPRPPSDTWLRDLGYTDFWIDE